MAAKPRDQRDLLHAWRDTPIAVPRSARELFQLFAIYDPAEGIDQLVGRMDFTGVEPRQIYHVVHQRAPDRIQSALPESYDPRKHFAAALESNEFQARAVALFLKAFADKRRNVFIHVPKCAGTDLNLNLAPRCLSLSQMLAATAWTSKQEFFEALSGPARLANFFDEILVYGHIELHTYLSTVGARFEDHIFTVMRDPVDLVVSQANYAVSRIVQDPQGKSPDSRRNLELLGLEAMPERPGKEALRELAIRALRDRRITNPNLICRYLGGPGEATAAAAMRNIVTHDVEVTDTAHYNAWLEERWGIKSTSRHNASEKFLSRDDVLAAHGDRLDELIGEDIKIFEAVTLALSQRKTSSIRGTDLAAGLVGSGRYLLDRNNDEIVAAGEGGAAPNLSDQLVVASGGVPAPAIQKVLMTEIGELAIVFGASGNSGEYRRNGWSSPEIRHTWTLGADTVLEIPRPTKPGTYVIAAQLAPFLWKDKLSAQRTTVIVNGREVGKFVVKSPTTIECRLPWDLIASSETVLITFHHPDCARPIHVSGVPDDREIALAFELLTLTLAKDEPDSAGARPSPSARPVAARPEKTKIADPTSFRDLVLEFESLGQNCEFGLVQRRCGAEPLGLLRFSSTPLPSLLAALDARFDGLGRADNLMVQLSSNGREYMVLDKRFGILYHPWVRAGEAAPEEILAREAKRLPYLTRKLIEDLTDGRKIFIHHGMAPLAETNVRRLLAALRRYGPNILLWVELHDRDHPAGMVEELTDGLLKGYIDQFAPGENAHDLSLDGWIALCLNAQKFRSG